MVDRGSRLMKGLPLGEYRSRGKTSLLLTRRAKVQGCFALIRLCKTTCLHQPFVNNRAVRCFDAVGNDLLMDIESHKILVHSFLHDRDRVGFSPPSLDCGAVAPTYEFKQADCPLRSPLKLRSPLGPQSGRSPVCRCQRPH